jgi:hypothetical protein
VLQEIFQQTHLCDFLFIEKEAASVRLDGIAGKLKELDKEFRQYQKEAEKIKQEYHPF